MAFTDVLGFEIATLLIAAALFAYLGVIGFVALWRGRPMGLRQAVRGAAVPVGALGVVVTGMGVWGELAWPLPGSYNILFSDVYLLFGIVLLAFAASALLSLHLQYVGVLGLVIGATVAFYGWSGYTLNMTKEPLEMLLLYAGFAAAAVSALPATIIADLSMTKPLDESGLYSERAARWPAFRSIGRSSRAVQPVVGAGGSSGELAPPSDAASGGIPVRLRLRPIVVLLVLLFPVLMVLAGIAAMFFLGSTIPSHLQKAP